MRVGQRIAAALALATASFALAVPTPTAATPAPRDTLLPPYLPWGGRYIAVYSNSAWRYQDVRAREITPVTTTHTDAGNTAATVWIGGCPTTNRTLRFHRSVRLLGPPSELIVRFDGSNDSATYSFTAFLNGTRVLASVPAGSYELGPRSRRLLELGSNELVVVARRTVSMYTSCNTFQGVFFGFEGRATMDLTAGYNPDGWPTAYARPGAPQTFDVGIGNRGPSRIPVAEFTAGMWMGRVMPDGGRAISLVVSGVQGAAVTACSRTANDDHWLITCVLRNLDPGESAVVSLTVRQRLQDVTTSDLMEFLSWSAYPPDMQHTPQDVNTGNNSALQEIIFCGHGSTTPGCVAETAPVTLPGPLPASVMRPAR